MIINEIIPTTPKVRACKVFTPDSKKSFNNIFKVSSYEYTINTLEDLLQAFRGIAAEGSAVIKGRLDRTLKDESRAGHTNPNQQTEWICLDADGIPGITTHEEFVARVLPLEFQGCSYIFQHSNSAGLATTEGFHGHLFFLLQEAEHPKFLKEWLKYINLTKLKEGLQLSNNYLTLKFPLDITTCQNDKLIYIASPQFIGMKDPIDGERIILVEKAEERVKIAMEGVEPPVIETKLQEVINKLRTDKGLEKRKAKYNGEVLQNPEKGIFVASNIAHGFVHGNVHRPGQTGDSNAYWHPEDNPSVLYNFKGEPPVSLQELDPSYYRAAMDTQDQIPSRVLAFRCRKRDTYFNGYYDPQTDTVDVEPVRTKDRIGDFMIQNGRQAPDIIWDWDMRFDPNDPKTIDFKRRFINLYQKSQIEKTALTLTAAKEIPPTIRELLFHVLGNSEEMLDEFINWLAVIFQQKVQTKSAWVLHGRTGTGKGMLYTDILKPLFDGATVMKQYHNLKEQWNYWAESTLITVFDEAKIEDRNKQQIMEKLKNFITESELSIQKKYENSYQATNYNNILLFSNNKHNILELTQDDRRFWIPPRQDEKYQYSEAKHQRLKEELLAFACYLLHHKTDLQRARNPKKTEAKVQLTELGMNSVDLFYKSLTEGDLTYLLNLVLEAPKTTDMDKRFTYNKAKELAIRFLNKPDGFMTLTELHLIYNYIQGDKIPINRFSKQMELKQIKLKLHQLNGRPVTGIYGNWKVTEEMCKQYEGLVNE